MDDGWKIINFVGKILKYLIIAFLVVGGLSILISIIVKAISVANNLNQ